MSAADRRRDAVARILRSRAIGTQEELLAALAEAGVEATQATLSRDLARLGARRVPRPEGAFYVFPDVRGLFGRPLGPTGRVVNSSNELAAYLLDEVLVATVPGPRQSGNTTLARAAFRHFGGHREFNPLAVVFRPLHRARTFRFWRPYRQLKQGHPEALERMEDTLLDLLNSQIPTHNPQP